MVSSQKNNPLYYDRHRICHPYLMPFSLDSTYFTGNFNYLKFSVHKGLHFIKNNNNISWAWETATTWRSRQFLENFEMSTNSQPLLATPLTRGKSDWVPQKREAGLVGGAADDDNSLFFTLSKWHSEESTLWRLRKQIIASINLYHHLILTSSPSSFNKSLLQLSAVIFDSEDGTSLWTW